jgi:probable addiction module antidote protein
MAGKKMTKTTRFDAAQYLDSIDAISAYLEEATASNDPAFIAHALGTIARARGMSRVAVKAGLSRESLYKALRADGNPEFATILRVMQALGLKFSVTPANDTKPRTKSPVRHRLSA